jgi:hypothetical protein
MAGSQVMLLEAELGQRLSELEAKFGTAGVPTDARLQLYDDLLDAIIFKSKLYGPLLSLIKHEYHLGRRTAVASPSQSQSRSVMVHSHKAAAAAAACGAALSPQGSGDFTVVAPGGKSEAARGGGSDDSADARGGAGGGGGGGGSGGGGGGHHPAMDNDTARSVEAEVDRQRARWEAERQRERDESKRKEKEQSAQVRARVCVCVCVCVCVRHRPWSLVRPQRAATEVVEPGQSLEISHRPHTLVCHQRDGRALDR